MKNTSSIFRILPGKAALAVLLSLVAAVTTNASTLLNYGGGVNLGAAGETTDWALFALSGGITITDTVSRTFDSNLYPTGPYNGNPTVRGNVGVAANSITLSGTTKVQGTAWVKTGGSLRKSGTAAINGNGGLALQGGANDALTDAAKNDAIAASAQAASLANNTSGVNFVDWMSMGFVNQNTDLSLIDTVGGSHVVLDLSQFVLTGGATFTLQGTAATTFVINVDNKFSLVGGKIVLAGGLLPEGVLFNVLNSGPDISLASGAEFGGILLAPGRTVNITGASKVGTSTLGGAPGGSIVAAKVNLSGGSTVNHLPFVSP